MQSQRLFLNSQSVLVRLTHSSRRSFFNMGGKSSAPSDSTTEFVNNAIKSDHIAVFSKSYCPYCDRTKQTLSQLNGVTVKTYELDEMDNGDEIQSALKALTGQSTVPNVFVGGKHVGGNDDTQSAFKSGKIHQMLSEAN